MACVLLLQDNDYVSAIKSVATILADYDSDQQFPAFGFGAKSPQFQGVSHCFPLNFNFNAPEVVGVQVCSYVCFCVCVDFPSVSLYICACVYIHSSLSYFGLNKEIMHAFVRGSFGSWGWLFTKKNLICKSTVYCKSFEVEKFRGFCGSIGNRKTFPMK